MHKIFSTVNTILKMQNIYPLYSQTMLLIIQNRKKNQLIVPAHPFWANQMGWQKVLVNA